MTWYNIKCICKILGTWTCFVLGILLCSGEKITLGGFFFLSCFLIFLGFVGSIIPPLLKWFIEEIKKPCGKGRGGSRLF